MGRRTITSLRSSLAVFALVLVVTAFKVCFEDSSVRLIVEVLQQQAPTEISSTEARKDDNSNLIGFLDDERKEGAKDVDVKKSAVCVFRDNEWLALFSEDHCSKQKSGIWIQDPRGEFRDVGECLGRQGGSYSFNGGKECSLKNAYATHKDTVSHRYEERKIPLALEWFERGYRDPWSFSVQRTGADDLHAALRGVLGRDNGNGQLPRVVVSFTSMPGRLARFGREMVELLKRQSYLPDAIYVALPKRSRRSSGDKDFAVPRWMVDDPLVTILRPEVDYGPATKLIAPIEEELRLGNECTRIITVDDDNEGRYDENMVMSLLAYSLVFEEAAIGLTGWNVSCILSDAHCDPKDIVGITEPQGRGMVHYSFIKPSHDYACHSLRDLLPDYYIFCMGAIRKNYLGYVDVIEGYAGALYQPRFFDLDVLKSIVDETKTPDSFFFADDVWFSGWLSLRNVSRLVVNPALHDSYEVFKKYREESNKRGLSHEILPQNDIEEDKDANAEEGLHSLSDFRMKNFNSVRWFEGKGGWTRGIWDKPQGFLYPSE